MRSTRGASERYVARGNSFVHAKMTMEACSYRVFASPSHIFNTYSHGIRTVFARYSHVFARIRTYSHVFAEFAFFARIRTYSHVFASIRTVFAQGSQRIRTYSHVFAPYSHTVHREFAQIRTVFARFARVHRCEYAISPLLHSPSQRRKRKKEERKRGCFHVC